MTHPEEERYTEYEITLVNRETSVGETETAKESEDEGETKVDEVVGKVINMRKYYSISFRLRVFISYE